jgi:hypothetical protein
MVPDLFENYARLPDAFQFIVDVPTDWEESIAIAGEVGDFVAIARKERAGSDWWIFLTKATITLQRSIVTGTMLIGNPIPTITLLKSDSSVPNNRLN